MTSSSRKIKHGITFEVLVPLDTVSISEDSQKEAALETVIATIFKENERNYEVLDKQIFSESDGNSAYIAFWVWRIVPINDASKELENLLKGKYVEPIPSEWKAKVGPTKGEFLQGN